MYKKYIFLLLTVILTACNAKETDLTDNVFPTEIQTTASIENSAELPIAEPAEVPAQDQRGDMDIDVMQNIYSQVVEGDLTALSQMENFDRIEEAYNNLNAFGDYEWKLIDIDHNGYEELVWQQKENVSYMKRIVGLFSFEKDPKCIIFDLNDSAEFYFISDSDNLVHYDQYFGMYRFFRLDGYTLDENLDLDFTYGLCLYDIYDLSEIDEDYLLEFQENNSDVVSEGIYYRKIVPQDNKSKKAKEILTEEQFAIEFTDLMGIDFYKFYEEFS